MAGRIAREEFKGTGLWVLAESRAFGAVGRIIPFHFGGLASTRATVRCVSACP